VQNLIIKPTVIVNRDQPVAAGGTILEAPQVHKQISFSGEIIRKTIHLGSLSIPVLYYYVTREVALSILLPMTVFSIIIDMGRHYVPAIQKMVAVLFDRILRPHERKAGLLSGATYVLISALFCVFVFPKLITLTAFAILIVSDSASALFGRAFGKHRFLDKSLEGTVAFVLSAWLVVLITPKAGPVAIEYLIAAIAAIIGGVFEAASATLRLDDNFAVPVSIGFAMWGGYLLLTKIDPARYEALYRAMLSLV
jgi:dolichol kinase